MKIYVVTAGLKYEHSYIQGVFSSYEKSQEVADATLKSGEYDYVETEEFVLDKVYDETH